ncbi:hypothetical protein DNTS_025308 [Danionella cerebrum]|uniref:RILP-like protein 2 n=1 Tax=Danionella cerebrum TaxID=2873325 RepID=A0A553PUY3_9TELE|nr:hypothetical protein DNTS_025308 [Danionella translucida]
MGDEGSALEKSAADLTVMDVYDIAALVGQEFERLIDRFGCEALARLVPKVVRVLELLEAAVTRSTSGTGGFTEAEELRLELERLRLERTERLERDRKHKKELELVEDVWRGEAQDLLSQIALLQQENQSLLSNLSVKESPDAEEETQRQEALAQESDTLDQWVTVSRSPRFYFSIQMSVRTWRQFIMEVENTSL